MRAFPACLAVVLGLGTCYIAACSSDNTTGGGAGEAGQSSSAGSSGTAGSPGSSGAPDAAAGAAEGGASGAAGAGAGSCAFTSDACSTCLTNSCGTKEDACAQDSACGLALSNLLPCACDASKTTAECESAFGTDGGALAASLISCFNANCTTACAM